MPMTTMENYHVPELIARFTTLLYYNGTVQIDSKLWSINMRSVKNFRYAA